MRHPYTMPFYRRAREKTVRNLRPSISNDDGMSVPGQIRKCVPAKTWSASPLATDVASGSSSDGFGPFPDIGRPSIDVCFAPERGPFPSTSNRYPLTQPHDANSASSDLNTLCTAYVYGACLFRCLAKAAHIAGCAP